MKENVERVIDSLLDDYLEEFRTEHMKKITHKIRIK